MPWAVIQTNSSVKDNIAWLSICAKRIMAGDSMSLSCYDTNPPLSIYLYAPPALLNDFTGFPIYYGVYLMAFLAIVLSCWASWKILQHLSFLDNDIRVIFVISQLVGTTLLTGLSYAERDHFMILGLIPFVLAQICITQKIKLPVFLLWLTLLVGAFAILLKPHYGLIPVVLLCHRLFVQKKLLRVLRDADFIALSISTLAYILFIALFHSDFITIILPDISAFYPNQYVSGLVLPVVKIYGVFFLFIWGAFLFYSKGQQENKKINFILLISFCGLLTVFLFFIQMKGFWYHRIPTYAFFSITVSLTLYILIKSILSGSKYSRLLKYLPTFACFTVFAFAYIKQPPNPGFTTHQQYLNAPLSTFINENCVDPCSIFITYENMGIISQTMFYQNDLYATRLPVFWFFPRWNSSDRTKMSTEQAAYFAKAHKRFANMHLEDLKRYKPSLLMIMRNGPDTPKDVALDLFDFMKVEPEYETLLKDYKKSGEFSIDRRYYYKNTKYDIPYTITWDVYTKPIEN